MSAPVELLAVDAAVEAVRALKLARVQDRIFRDRAHPVWGSSLREGDVVVLVYLLDGAADLESENHPRVYEETAQLEVELLTLSSEEADRQVWEVAGAVREALFLEHWAGGHARDVRFRGFRSSRAEEGGRILASLALRFELMLGLAAPEYRPADDLHEIHETTVVGPAGTPTLEQTIALEQPA